MTMATIHTRYTMVLVILPEVLVAETKKQLEERYLMNFRRPRLRNSWTRGAPMLENFSAMVAEKAVLRIYNL